MSEFGPQPWVQRHWDLRAATNFMLGGTGAGLLVASAIAMPSPRFAIATGLVLIAAGLAAVWLEIGRKLRALHVFFNPGTSWMTRESFAALVVFALGASALVLPQRWLPPALALRCTGDGCEVETEAGVRRFDTLYPVLGSDGQSQLATALGAAAGDNGELEVDAHLQTSIDGLYALGDVVVGLNQIGVAMGHAAIAATAVHNRLPRNWREAQD